MIQNNAKSNFWMYAILLISNVIIYTNEKYTLWNIPMGVIKLMVYINVT